MSDPRTEARKANEFAAYAAAQASGDVLGQALDAVGASLVEAKDYTDTQIAAIPAQPDGSDTVKGIVQVDGVTITATGGVISAVGGGGGGSGDVNGPASSTNNHIAQFDGTTGKLLKDGGLSSATFDAAGAATTAQTNAEAYADSLAPNYDAAGAASTAQTAAEAYADSLAPNYDAAGAAATAQTNAEAYADSAVAAIKLRILSGTPGRKPDDAEVLFSIYMVSGDQLPSGLSGSKIGCTVAPTSSFTVTLKKNGSSIGTGTISSAATTGSWSFSSTISFSNGDILSATAISPQDATLSGLSILLLGTRTA